MNTDMNLNNFSESHTNDCSVTSSLGILDIDKMDDHLSSNMFGSSLLHDTLSLIAQKGNENLISTIRKSENPQLKFPLGALKRAPGPLRFAPIPANFFEPTDSQWSTSTTFNSIDGHHITSNETQPTNYNLDLTSSRVDFDEDQISAHSSSLAMSSKSASSSAKSTRDQSVATNLKNVTPSESSATNTLFCRSASTISSKNATIRQSALITDFETPHITRDSGDKISSSTRVRSKSTSNQMFNSSNPLGTGDPIGNFGGSMSWMQQPEEFGDFVSDFGQAMCIIDRAEESFTEQNKLQIGSSSVCSNPEIGADFTELDISHLTARSSFLKDIPGLRTTEEAPKINKDVWFGLQSGPVPKLGDKKSNRAFFGMDVNSPKEISSDGTPTENKSKLNTSASQDPQQAKERRKEIEEVDETFRAESALENKELWTIDESSNELTIECRDSGFAGYDTNRNAPKKAPSRCYSTSCLQNQGAHNLQAPPMRSRSVSDNYETCCGPQLHHPVYSQHLPMQRPAFDGPSSHYSVPNYYGPSPQHHMEGLYSQAAERYPYYGMHFGAPVKTPYMPHPYPPVLQETAPTVGLSGCTEIFNGVVCLDVTKAIDFTVMNSSNCELLCCLKEIVSCSLNQQDGNSLVELGVILPKPFTVPPRTPKRVQVLLTSTTAGKFEGWVEVLSRIPNENTFVGSFVTHISFLVEQPKIKAYTLTENQDPIFTLDFGPIDASEELSGPILKMMQVKNHGAAMVPATICINMDKSQCGWAICFAMDRGHSSQSQSLTFFNVNVAACEIEPGSEVKIPIRIYPGEYNCSKVDCKIGGSIWVNLRGETPKCLLTSLEVSAMICHQGHALPETKKLSERSCKNSDSDKPKLKIAKRNLFFPGVAIGKKKSQNLILLNNAETGEMMVTLKIGTGQSDFHFLEELGDKNSKVIINLSPGSMKSVTIAFCPSKVQAYYGTVSIKWTTNFEGKPCSAAPVKLYGFGGVSQICIENEDLQLTPGLSSHVVKAANRGQRPAFLSVLPVNAKLLKIWAEPNQTIVMPAKDKEIKIHCKVDGFPSDFNQKLSVIHCDKELWTFVASWLRENETSKYRQRKLDLPHNLKVADVFPFKSDSIQEMLNCEDCPLYPSVQKDVLEIFCQTIVIESLILKSAFAREDAFLTLQSNLSIDATMDDTVISLPESEQSDVSKSAASILLSSCWDIKPSVVSFKNNISHASFSIINKTEDLHWFRTESSENLESDPQHGLLKPKENLSVQVHLLSRSVNPRLVIRCNGGEKVMRFEI